MNTYTKPLRVLIADDHAPTRADVRHALEHDLRFDVCVEAEDAAAAVFGAVRARPDVCLIDIRMPGNGVAATWEIAARLPHAKIVMLTVSDEDSDIFAALRAGAHGYLLKTMSLNRLPNALQGVCCGEAAMPRTLMARVLDRFHGREPRWRRLASNAATERHLTSREWEVLEFLARGWSTAEIAEGLKITASAVRAHITSIVHKFEVPDRAAVVQAFRRYADS